MRFIEWWLPVRENCRPAYFNSYEAKSLQLTLTACYLAHTVLNIWSYLRLPGGCYPMADLPCRDGIYTRLNNRPCSAALSLTARDMNRAQLATTITRRDAGVEPPWMVSRRVVAGCARFMSRIHANIA